MFCCTNSATSTNTHVHTHMMLMLMLMPRADHGVVAGHQIGTYGTLGVTESGLAAESALWPETTTELLCGDPRHQ